jgi:hypothetical protein
MNRTAETAFDNLKKFESLFQGGHKSTLVDQTLAKLVEIELFELNRELREVTDRISVFEKQYGMETEQFLIKFNAGEIGDDADYVEWFAYSDMGDELRRKIEILDTP